MDSTQAYHPRQQGSSTESTPLLRRALTQLYDHDDGVRKMTMLWEEIRTIFLYTLPIFGSYIIEYSLLVVPVITVGHLSTTALAAISLGSMTSAVTGRSILQGLASALDTLLPAAWTSSQPHLTGLWAQRMWVVLMLGSIPIWIIWLQAETIFIALRQDPEVSRLAALFLRWFSLTLPAYCFNIVSRRYFQAQGLLSLQTWLMVCAASVNAVLNYLLVWGPESIRLGFIGAPISIVISYYVVTILSIVGGILYVPPAAWHPISREMFLHLEVVFRLGVSGIGQIASEWWAWELVGFASSFLGPVALASQSVLITSAATLNTAPFGLVSAATVRIGNLLGEKDARRAEAATSAALILGFSISAFSSLALIIFRDSWAYMFNNDQRVVQLVASVLPIISLYKMFDGIVMVSGGILRVRGEQFIGALLNLSGYYIIGLPIGLWLAFPAGQGLSGLWIGLSIALLNNTVVGLYLVSRTNWDVEVEKVLRRLEAEERLKKGRGDPEQTPLLN